MPRAKPIPALTLDTLPDAEQAKFRLRLKELGYTDPHEIVSKVYDKRHSAKWEEGWTENGKFKKARPEQLAPPGDWMTWVYLGVEASGKRAPVQNGSIKVPVHRLRALRCSWPVVPLPT